MRFQNLVVAIAVLCGFRAVSQDKAPDLSGIWRVNHQKSHSSGIPPEDMRVKIEQNGSELTMTERVLAKGEEEMTSFRYRVGSDDNRNEIHSAPMKSNARWQEAALAIDSVATFGADDLHMNDVWTLSADGQTLTLKERHQFGTEPAGEDTYVFDRQAGGNWEPPQKPKAAEEVYKNIQVMKGIPAPRLMPAMMFFAKSLGVDCSHCHVPNDFPKDDKPAKETARRMLKMVHQINADNFPDNQPVSCWTCHRGGMKPESAPK